MHAVVMDIDLILCNFHVIFNLKLISEIAKAISTFPNNDVDFIGGVCPSVMSKISRLSAVDMLRIVLSFNRRMTFYGSLLRFSNRSVNYTNKKKKTFIQRQEHEENGERNSCRSQIQFLVVSQKCG